MEQAVNLDERESGGSLAYPWFIVSLCMLAYIFSFIDRQVITLLIEPIRADLQISDTQFSLLHGLAFAMLYAVAGIPIARLADSRSRPLIISVGIFIWSFATAACGLAKSFVQLFLARMAVGVGEAALSPAAYSMISDSFPKSKLGLAIGVYSSGSFLGGGLAFIIGGAAIAVIEQWGAQTFPVIGLVKPWQMTFVFLSTRTDILCRLLHLRDDFLGRIGQIVGMRIVGNALHPVQIGTGREAFALRRHHHGADIVAPRQLREHRLQARYQRAVQRIVDIRTVQGDPRHPMVRYLEE